MAEKNPFVHLHFHTQYSLLDGACKISQVMDAAEELEMPAVAITDHGVMYGAVDFYKKAKAKGIKPIIGCEVYMAPPGTSMHEKKRAEDGSQSNHFVLLAKNETGYNNLAHLVSKAHLEGFYYKARIDKELLSRHSEGLIGLSACLKGEVAEHCVEDDIDGAVKVAGEFADILGKENFYLEMMDHGMKEQRIVNDRLVKVSKATGLPLVCTNDVHYLSLDHYEAHDVMLCLQMGTTMSDPRRMQYESNQLYMKSQAEMYALFPEHHAALARTLEIADRCNFDFRFDLTGEQLHFPKYTVPEGFTAKQYLIKIAKEGLEKRYGIRDLDHPANEDEKKVHERFYYEMGIIEVTGFVNYFLVVWDFINYAREQGIPVGPGRGSGAGCIVAYALGITNLDPLKYNLIFERFLNPERVSPPDFDIDFCQARRGEVIEYVKDKYGRDHVAQIITFGTLGAKTVIRDLGRVLEIPLSECDRLAKMVPEDPGMNLKKALAGNPEFKRACQTEPHAKQIMKYAKVLEGLPRNPGTHAAGVVIGEKPLHEILPLARDKDKEPVTQYEMKPLEQVGLLKMDFLGLRTLTLIQEAVNNVQKTRGIEIIPDEIPLEDEATFALLNRGDTHGVFQVESAGMQSLLRQLQLSKFEELIAMIALYRPGPMDMIPDFIARKHGTQKIEYPHPLLADILKETYGVMIYQEQVQQAANVLAGFSLGQGDMLRRAMGKKIASEMAKQRKNFVEGCSKTNNIPEKLANSIFDTIDKFAGYGFNKSHSAAYAVISWQTAYLKAHYPVEFMAALMTSEIHNSEKLRANLDATQAMGIEVLPPSVNESDMNFTPVGNSIRFGLVGVKNVGTSAVEALIREREANGPFESLIDFCSRVDSQYANRKMLESLVKCGAFDFTKMSRGRMFNGIDFAIARAQEAQQDKASGQGSLFDMLDESASSEPSVNELPEAAPWSASEMLLGEKELLGFYISGHPLHEYSWTLKTFCTADTANLESLIGKHLRIGGMVTGFAKRFTKTTQEAMGTFKLEHLDGTVEAVCFSGPFKQYGVYLKEDAAVLLCGELNMKNDQVQMKAAEVYPLGEAARHFTTQVILHLKEGPEAIKQLEQLRPILRHAPGDVPVMFCFHLEGDQNVYVDTDRSYKITPGEELLKDVAGIIGDTGIELKLLDRIYRNPESGKRRRWGQKAQA